MATSHIRDARLLQKNKKDKKDYEGRMISEKRGRKRAPDGLY